MSEPQNASGASGLVNWAPRASSKDVKSLIEQEDHSASSGEGQAWTSPFQFYWIDSLYDKEGSIVNEGFDGLVELLDDVSRHTCEPYYDGEKLKCRRKDKTGLYAPIKKKDHSEGFTASNIEEVYALIFDLDHLADPDLQSIIKSFDGYDCYVHSTHSHNPPDDCCFRVLLQLSRPVPGEQWSAFYKAAATFLGLTSKHDRSTVDPSRRFYIPEIPENAKWDSARVRGSKKIDVDHVLSLIPAEPKRDELPKATLEAYQGCDTLSRASSYLQAIDFAVSGEGGSTPTYRAACVLVHGFDLTPDTAFNLLQTYYNPRCSPPWSEKELRHKVNDADRKQDYKGRPRGYMLTESIERAKQNQTIRDAVTNKLRERASQKGDPEKEDSQSTVFDRGCYTKDGKIRATLDNACKVIVADEGWRGVLAFDEFSQNVMCVKAPPFYADTINADELKPGPWKEFFNGVLVRWFARHPTWPIELKEALADSVVNQESRRNKFHPIKDYLNTAKWDGVPRIDTWLSVYMGVEDTAYSRAVGAKWLISAVARINLPGCQAKYMLMLEGNQDLGKSKAIRALVGNDWFTDDMPGLDDSQEAALHLQGSWVIEFAELEALSKADAQKTKAFISRQIDKFRAPYDRRPAAHPRQCVFIGTTNREDYATDDTGNVRFWPVLCTKADAAAINQDRDQLWAEAKQRFDQGEPWHIEDDSVLSLAREEQELRHTEHPWTNKVLEYAQAESMCAEREGREAYIIIDDLLENALWIPLRDIKQTHKNVVGGILRKQGWVQGRERTGKRRRIFTLHTPSTSVHVAK